MPRPDQASLRSVANPDARDPALDLLRAGALIRVVLWHAFAATWLTAIAAMPLMFFVAGALLPSAGDWRSYRSLLARRGRRLLLPLWVYGTAIAVTVIHLGSVSSPFPSTRSLMTVGSWLFPLVDPLDSPWHSGWLSNHLWYLRAYLWVLLLAPIFVMLARKLREGILILVLMGLQLEVAHRLEIPVIGSGTFRVLVGDLVTYGLFVLLGIAYRQRSHSINHRLLLLSSLASGGLAVIYCLTQELPLGGINASYPAITLTGLAWIFAVGALERPIAWLASTGPVRRGASAICKRALTIYLWHLAAIVAAYHFVEEAVPARPFVIAGFTVVATWMAVLTFGWVEDLAAGRSLRLKTPRLAARLIPLVAVATVAMTIAPPTLIPSSIEDASASAASPLKALAPPSYRTNLANSAFAGREPKSSNPIGLINGRVPPAEFQRTLDSWMSGHTNISRVAVAISIKGQSWSGEPRNLVEPNAVRANDRFPVGSLTKTFTLAMVLREVESGRLGLDAPPPAVAGIRSRPQNRHITVRHLLQHTSGLVDYPNGRGYRSDRPLTAAKAVDISFRIPLQSQPGAEVRYANVNYLYLGLILETTTGRTYSDLLSELASTLGLSQTVLETEDRPGWVGFSSGGVHSTVVDLARWGEALFTPGRVIPAHQVAQLTTLDGHNKGLGTWPLCPCWTDAKGVKRYTAIGHQVCCGGLYYYPGQMTLAVRADYPETEDPVASLGEAFRGVLRR